MKTESDERLSVQVSFPQAKILTIPMTLNPTDLSKTQFLQHTNGWKIDIACVTPDLPVVRGKLLDCHVQESRRDALSMVRSCDPKPVYPSQVILISRRDEAQYFIVSQAKQYRLGVFINAPKNLRWSILFALLHSCSLVVHVLLRYDFGDEI